MTQPDSEELLEEFERTGEVAALHTAIEILRTTGENPVNLSHALRLLGEETADPAVLEDAARTAEQAQSKAPPGSGAIRRQLGPHPLRDRDVRWCLPLETAIVTHLGTRVALTWPQGLLIMHIHIRPRD
jgi:hypothetical protein